MVARRGRLVIAETRHGLVGANALVDASNAGGDRLVLLPADPDASAARLRADLEALDGHDVAVVVTDTLGRPWRLGQTDVAVGLAGMGALDDWRGRADGDGRPLEVTEVAVADEVAAAADLVKGKASRVPAALLRGVRRPGDGRARDLVRAPADDLFRTAGTAEDLLAFLEGPPPPAGWTRSGRPGGRRPRGGRRPGGAAARRAPLRGRRGPRRRPRRLPGRPLPTPALAGAPTLLACCLAGPGAGDPGVELAAGGALRTLVLGLHALGVGAVFEAAPPAARPALAGALRLDPAWRPLGLLGAAPPNGGRWALAGLGAGQAAVAVAVEEVDDEAEGHPDQEPPPGQGAEVQHQEHARDHGQDRDQRDRRGPEGPRQVGLGAAQHDDPDRHQHEGEQGADVDHVGQGREGHEGGDEGHDHAGDERDHPGRAVAGVDGGQPAGQQPVAAHGEQDPALAHQQDEDDRGQPGQRPQRDQAGDPVVADRLEGVGHGGGGVQLRVLDHPGQHQRHDHVQQVQMASDPRMPMGMSRWGLRVSSAVVATTSKPMKAKNTIAAPKPMPSQP